LPHSTDLIATLAVGFGLAFVFGLLAARLKLPPIVGYLVAGVAIGPFTPGFVADRELAAELAEIGVILLMFGVGLHFSLKQLIAVRAVALPGAVVQIMIATALGTGFALALGWSLVAGVTFGLALSVASTVVLLRALTERRILDSLNGRIAVGWLIVEDLVMVLALVLLPALAESFGGQARGLAGAVSGGDVAVTLGVTLAKVGAFLAFMLVVGRRVLPWLLERVARTGSRELFTLSIAGAALGIAYGSAELFGVSFALGAFFAGVIISESELSHRAAAESLPLQDVFAVLFFVSVGMLFNPAILIERPAAVAVAVAIVLIGKSIAAFAIVLLLRYPIRTALTVSVSLAQIGEFSFILAALGVSLQLMPQDGQDLILATALISITLNPLLFRALGPMQAFLRTRPALCRALERGGAELRTLDGTEDAPLTGHAILVGYGRVGRQVGEKLKECGRPFVVVDYDRGAVAKLREEGVSAIYGDAAANGILEQAGVENAALVVATTADPLQTRQVVDIAKRLSPDIDLVVRTHDEEELAWFEKRGVGLAIMGERELAASMSRYALQRLGVEMERADAASNDVRRSAVAGDAAWDVDVPPIEARPI
jgi:CPA2 family monovalent cation:H+ antiporter-2